MEHKCEYFSFEEGVLVCSVCGKPADKQPGLLEDKNMTKRENKAVQKSVGETLERKQVAYDEGAEAQVARAAEVEAAELAEAEERRIREEAEQEKAKEKAKAAAVSGE